MNKIAVSLIVIAAVVAIGGYWYVSSLPVPEPPPEADGATRRTTESGDVVGFIAESGARAWLGVPFARPPVGQRRWKAPEPSQPAGELIEALDFGSPCPQLHSQLTSGGDAPEPGRMVGDEDCLHLNVWSPPNASGLPVMLWIHGGGNSIGHGGNVVGANLAAARQVVVVSINYRLGLFGWFNHPALASGDPTDDSGNYGTLDMIRALEWTRDNIAAFGGDPSNVTVFGESAGAFDTLAMMASPLAKGLFHRAIVQSGGYGATAVAYGQAYEQDGGHPNSAAEVAGALLLADGLAADAVAARALLEGWPAAKLAEYLHGKTPAELYAVLDGDLFGMVDLPANFMDGHVLPAAPAAEVFSVAENHNQVPVILGTNRDEPTLFMSRDPRYVDDLFGLFYSLKDEAAYLRQVRYGARAWKARGVDELAQRMVASGNPNVFAYRWDWDEEPTVLGYDLSVALGAGHALEIPFVFGDFSNGLGGIHYIFPNDENQRRLSASMMSYWTQFAYSGAPGKGRDGAEVEWLPWGREGKTSILLDTPTDGGIRMDDATVTHASIKAELIADPEFPELKERCETYVRIFRRSGLFDADEYADLGCSDYPPEGVSWF